MNRNELRHQIAGHPLKDDDDRAKTIATLSAEHKPAKKAPARKKAVKKARKR